MVTLVWDVSLTPVKQSGQATKKEAIRITLPLPLSRSLIDRGYTRTTIHIIDEGILLVPHSGESTVSKVALPGWNGAEEPA